MKSKRSKSPIRIFLASSRELQAEREKFENFIHRTNSLWKNSDKPMLELQIWETSSDTLSFTRSQDEYNKAIKHTDIFVLMFCSKVGKYKQEEFDLAKALFHRFGKPQILIFQKNSPAIDLAAASFLEKLNREGAEYFHVRFDVYPELENSFRKELDIYLSNSVYFN